MSEIYRSAQARSERKDARPALVAAGGVLGALAASSCCLLPLALFGLGASGAWIGALSALSPYQPVFVAVAAGFLVAGFWMIYRKPKAELVSGATCVPLVSRRVVKSALWSATALVIAAAAFPYVAPILLDV